MANVLKTHQTSRKKCGKHLPHKVTVQKARVLWRCRNKRPYDRRQSGCGGQTESIFHKKATATKKVVRRLKCIKPNYTSKRMLAMKRCEHSELGGAKKRKSQVIQFSASHFVLLRRQILGICSL
ncbi:60S ribosomal protein L36a-like [Sturnira hondurensis]|uniref:60S ribosomal protein L36a-like n=1 Tax=Sturnira hondurensis TaxID=192404 RepID=UPI00187A0B02|nr:60S ribosomal protein L36a-like [Sturnira hondurensis]